MSAASRGALLLLTAQLMACSAAPSHSAKDAPGGKAVSTSGAEQPAGDGEEAKDGAACANDYDLCG